MLKRRMWLGLVVLVLWGVPLSHVADGTVTITRGGGVDHVPSPSGAICNSIDIRNTVKDFEQLRNCSVVEGFVQIVLIDKANESDFENLSFPQLREITCYLILYRVKGLKSLGSLFPNLTIIRGNTLFQDYALVVYEMLDLQDLGLWSLTAILRGSVRIEKNYQLCYYNTVKWEDITNGGEHYIENNKAASSCPGSGICDTAGCNKAMCWGSQVHNCRPLREHGDCHELCLGGCSGPRADQCFVCKGVLNNGECLPECPPDRYSYLGRRCVNASECLSMQTSHSIDVQPYGDFSLTNWWPFNKTCVHQCPPEYQKLETANGTLCQWCHGPCSIECRGGVVSSIADAQLLRGCTTITSLEIFIRGSGSHIVRELEENLAAIEEIQGYLKVSRSFPLTSLNFLKNLRVIHGNELEDKRYSLLVFENQNLQELWNWTNRPPLKIKNGALKFHYNPKLCLSEIDKLQEIAGLQNYSNFDVSRESNGDKVACNVVTLFANATVLSSKTVLIEWEPCQVPDPSSVLGYMVYYIEAPERNVTEHDGLDACGDNGWRVVDFPYDTDNTSHASPCTNLIQFLPHLEPFTQYAYYVKTYTKTNTGGQSNIKYFRTRPDRPSVPKELCAVSNSSSNIILQWLPPEYPNGILSHYLISGKWMKDDQRYLDQRNYCKYPLEHIPNPDVQITPSSTSESVVAQSCCEVQESEPLVLIEDADDYQKLCVFGPARKLGDDVDPCGSYFYSFIHTGIPELLHTKADGLGDRFPDQLPSASAPGEEMPFNTSIINVDGVFEQFLEKIDANTTYKVLRNLHHFAEYTINVFACREPHSTEPQHLMKNIDYQSFCSPAGIVSIRTKPLSTADKIEYAHLAVDISNTSRSVKLTWKEPRKPNGIVVSYSIEHKRIDIENFQPVLDCISRKEYVDYGGGLVLNNLSPGNYTFRVKATSLAGEGQFTEQFSFHLEERPVESAAGVLTGILLTALFVLLVLAVASFLWWRKRVKERIMIIADVNPDYMSSSQSIYVEDEWEVPREKVKLLKELGQGSFGMVYEGLLKPEDARCAVKMISENASIREKIEFLNEAHMMKSFAGAQHVVNLLGVVSKGQPALVIMELMGRGDLKTYLRASREPPPPPPDLQRMLIMAAQIADGMAYLEAHKFVHRDLAARNCMVAEDLTIKIGDFGMTRDIYETDYYRNGSKGLLPVRWMSPESLADGVFTSQSDVWSFGVVLWEMTTLAEQPYQGLANEQVLQFVLGGGTLERPLCCPDIMHNLMMECWQRRPTRRPRFLQLVAELEVVVDLGARFREASFYHSKEGQEMKAHMDQHPQQHDTSLDDLSAKSPPVSFYQLLEEDGRTSHINDSDSYVLPGNHRRCPPSQATVPSHHDVPNDSSYVLPGPSGNLPPETECLLPGLNSEFETIHNATDISPRRRTSRTGPPSVAEDGGYVPAESVYVHPDSVDDSLSQRASGHRRKVSFAEPEAGYVPTENALQPISRVHSQTRESDSANSSSGASDLVGRTSQDEAPVRRRQPSVDHLGSASSETPESEADKDRRYRPPNGVVNGFYISVPQNQDDDDDSELVPRFK